jgi:hypothetical protein
LLRTALILALIAALGFLGALQLPRFGGRYLLRNSDHADIMTSGETAQTGRTVTILFVGNSLTFFNDMPAMLVNIAASDPGSTTQLAVKAITAPGASLDEMLSHSDALAWIGAHPVDFVVLQEHSFWYELPEWTAATRRSTRAWRDALRPLRAKPVLFESWADADGNNSYFGPDFSGFGKTFNEVTLHSEAETAALAQELGMPVVRVARAFYGAVRSARAPDLYQPDRHHPSRAGSYLAALAFYRYFTGRSGAASSYRPWGVSAADKALLVEAAGR